MEMLEAGLCLCPVSMLMLLKGGDFVHLYEQISETSGEVLICPVCTVPLRLAPCHHSGMWLFYWGIACSSYPALVYSMCHWVYANLYMCVYIYICRREMCEEWKGKGLPKAWCLKYVSTFHFFLLYEQD